MNKSKQRSEELIKRKIWELSKMDTYLKAPQEYSMESLAPKRL